MVSAAERRSLAGNRQSENQCDEWKNIEVNMILNVLSGRSRRHWHLG